MVNNNGSVPLSLIGPGKRARLLRIEAGRQASHRLTELGLTPGVELEVLRQDSHGPLLVAVRDTRLAVGRGMAHKVLVKPID
jgi:Fe2+ transport system protein FeoA